MDPSNSSDVTRIIVNTAFRDATSRSTGNYGYSVREAVGVFSVPEALERAVDELEVSGFDRAALSVLASQGTIKDRVGHLYRNIAEIADGRYVPQRAFVESDSRVEGTAAAIGIPCYIGSIAGARSHRGRFWRGNGGHRRGRCCGRRGRRWVGRSPRWRHDPTACPRSLGAACGGRPGPLGQSARRGCGAPCVAHTHQRRRSRSARA